MNLAINTGLGTETAAGESGPDRGEEVSKPESVFAGDGGCAGVGDADAPAASNRPAMRLAARMTTKVILQNEKTASAEISDGSHDL